MTIKFKNIVVIIFIITTFILVYNSDEEYLPILSFQHIEPWQTTQTKFTFYLMDFPDSTFKYQIFHCTYQTRLMKPWFGDEYQRHRVLDGIYVDGKEPYSISYDSNYIIVENGCVIPKKQGKTNILIGTKESVDTTQLIINYEGSKLIVKMSL